MELDGYTEGKGRDTLEELATLDLGNGFQMLGCREFGEYFARFYLSQQSKSELATPIRFVLPHVSHNLLQHIPLLLRSGAQKSVAII